MAQKRKIVFISYSSANQAEAKQVRDGIPNQFEVWFDEDKIKIGDDIGQSIAEGLDGSDYYVLLISEDSNKSTWVRREIATAFELANHKKLSVIPFLLQGATVPLEFRGLLYIDGRESLTHGIQKLKDFLLGQLSQVKRIDPTKLKYASENTFVQQIMNCSDLLRSLSLGDLRFRISERLTMEEIEVVWFDLFNRRMVDEVQVKNVALSAVELIDRCRRNQQFFKLLDILCRNNPNIGLGRS